MNEQIILVQPEPQHCTYLVEVPVSAGQQRIQLPDVQQLRSMEGQTIVIKSISVVTPDVLANAIDLALPTSPVTDLQNMSLTIYSQAWERGQNIPILRLNDMTNSDTSILNPNNRKTFTLDNWKKVDWPKSYLRFSNGQSASTDFAVLLYVNYFKMDEEGNEFFTP